MGLPGLGYKFLVSTFCQRWRAEVILSTSQSCLEEQEDMCPQNWSSRLQHWILDF